ncbi:MAG TPA: zinc-binding dehydrogenase [Candidatus Limnocylindrales bacterium]|nr:zinc-binding dehydrogenase [Candidatus Limnocylindrales bacterium]
MRHGPNWEPALILGIRRLMRAAVLRAPGDPAGIRIESVADPVPGAGEVLVRVSTVCVNRTDVHVLHRTNIGRGVPLPHIGGLDPAGVVVGHGPGVETPAIGTRVVARPMIPCLGCRFCGSDREALCEHPTYVGVHRPGGFAELVALPARAVFPIPDGVDDATASAAAHSVPVVLHQLDTVGQVTDGDRVLVVGAAGGLGLVAVQLARHLGATIVAAAGSDDKLAILRGLGAAEAISYAVPEGFADRVRAATGGLGVSVAVDNVGSRVLWPEVVAALDKGGRILSCGAHADGRVEVDLALFYRLQLRLVSTAGASRAEFERALSLVHEGTVRPVVHREWPLEGIGDALAELLARRNVGKIVLRVGPDVRPRGRPVGGTRDAVDSSPTGAPADRHALDRQAVGDALPPVESR